MDSQPTTLVADAAFKTAEMEKERDELAGVGEEDKEEESLEEAVVRPWSVARLGSQWREAYAGTFSASLCALSAAESAVHVAKLANNIAAIATYNAAEAAEEAARLAVFVDQSASAVVSTTLAAARAATGPTMAAVVAASAATAASTAASAATQVGCAVAAVNKQAIFGSVPIRGAIAAAFERAAAQFATAATAATTFDEAFASSGAAGDAIPTAHLLREAGERLKTFSKGDAFYVPYA